MRFSRLFQFLAMLALLLAPAGMLGSHAAMAMPHQPTHASMNPCDMQKNAPEDEQRQSMIDCTIACSAMPSSGSCHAPRPMLTTPEYKRVAILDVEGTRPEAATPPPRYS